MLAVAGYFWAARQAETAQRHFKNAEAQRERAERAEAQTKDALRDAYLAQAQANRQTHRAGRRFDSLATIAKAAAIKPSLALRNEAIACLATPDLRMGKQWVCSTGGVSVGPYFAFDSRCERYARNEEGAISIRRVADDVELVRLASPGAEVQWVLRFSPDDRLLAARYRRRADAPALFRVWDWEARKIMLQLTNVLDAWAVDFHPTSRLIALGRADKTVVIYDLASGQSSQTIPQREEPLTLCFDPAGTRLAVCFESPTVVIWDWRSGRLLRTLAHPDYVQGLAWHSDGVHLATACENYRVYVVDASTGKTRAVLSGHQAEVTQVLFPHRGDLLASTSWDGTLRLWDAFGGTELISTVFAAGERFSRDDRWLSHNWDGSRLGLLELACGHECRVLSSNFKSSAKGPPWVEFSPDGRWLAAAHADGIRLWDAASAHQIAIAPSRECRKVLFHPSGRSLIASTQFGSDEWPIEFDATNQTLRMGPAQAFPAYSGDGCASLGRQGQYLAVGGTDHVRVFDVPTRRERARLGPCPKVTWVSISPDGEWVAAGNFHGSGVRLFRVSSTNLVKELPAPESASVGFSPT